MIENESFETSGHEAFNSSRQGQENKDAGELKMSMSELLQQCQLDDYCRKKFDTADIHLSPSWELYQKKVNECMQLLEITTPFNEISSGWQKLVRKQWEAFQHAVNDLHIRFDTLSPTVEQLEKECPQELIKRAESVMETLQEYFDKYGER